MKSLAVAAFSLLSATLLAQAPRSGAPQQRQRIVAPGMHYGNSVVAIDGAFGIKLGDTFSPEAGAKPRMISGLEVYNITPKVPNPLFSLCQVHVSVISRKICMITAECESVSDGVAYRKVQTFLAQKYGGDITVDATSFGKDGRLVYLEEMPSLQQDLARFKITYCDTELCLMANVEHRTTERKKLVEGFDGAGL